MHLNKGSTQTQHLHKCRKTPKHPHTALISTNCWQWLLRGSFVCRKTNRYKWERERERERKQGDEQSERALRTRQMQRWDGWWGGREGEWLLPPRPAWKVSNTPPQIVKMDASWIAVFYEPERKNTATAASVGDVWGFSAESKESKCVALCCVMFILSLEG